MWGSIDISSHAYQTLLFHVSRPQSLNVIGGRYNAALVPLSEQRRRQKKSVMCVRTCIEMNWEVWVLSSD